MSTQRLIASLVALALMIGVMQVLVWWLQPAPSNRIQAGPPRSGYTLHDFTLYGYGQDGALSYRLHAPRLQRREGDASMYLTQPDFLLPAKSGQPGEPWTGDADHGWVSAKGDQLKLQGNVKMHRPAFASVAATRIDTNNITAWPQQNRLSTKAITKLAIGPSVMYGTGMSADFSIHNIKLLHDVHGEIAPAKD